MTNLHVVYDPTEKLVMAKLPEEIKFAMMHIAEDLSNEEIQVIVEDISTILLEQIRIDRK